MAKIKATQLLTLVLLSVIYQSCVIEAGDTEIRPIPTVCPEVDPLNYTVHLQHESDCTKFYKCDHGERVLFDCPDGLHFNPLLQVCDWPDQVGCDSRQSSSAPLPSPTPPPNRDPACPWPDPLDDTVHLPYDGDCSKFYKCDNGIKVEFDCPDGLHFNPELEVCDWPERAGCEDVRPPGPSPTNAPPQPSPTSAPPQPPPDRDPECPWPDPLDHTVHLPHQDCSKFYKCDNGRKVEFDCPDGLHFNAKLEVCDWPQDAGCEDVRPPVPSTSRPEPSPTNAPPQPSSTSAPPQPPPDRDPECPWPDPLDHTVHLPHKDCSKFYKCDNGRKVEFDCPDGLHFNAKLEVCDWPQDAGCEDVRPPVPSTSRPEPSPTNAPPQPSSTSAPPQPPPDRDPECPWPDPLDHTVHLPHKDCSKFYKCDNGRKVEFDCPDGLHFNAKLEVCDWPQDAGCEDVRPPVPSTSRPEPSPTNAPPQPSSTSAPPQPPPDRDPECPWPDPLDHTVHLPHKDCSKFYKCDNGRKVEFDCPDGLHFNAKLEVCDWPQDAGCEDVRPPVPSTSRPEPSPTNAPPQPSSTSAPPQPPPDRDPECPWPDPLDHTVHLPHQDCSKFYKCDNGRKVEFDCPDGLHFNPELEVCDWPERAGCEDVPPPVPSTSRPEPSPTNAPTQPSPTSAPPQPPPDRDDECPWPDPLDHTVHLPHEDCSKFYKCDNGRKIEFDCPDGLHFNAKLEVCDWPQDAGCQDIPPPISSSSSKPSPAPTASPQPPTPPEDRDDECPWPDPLDHTVHLPHDDCSKFYKCDNGRKVEFDCPDGLHFNAQLQVCDWPQDAGCENVPSSSSPKPSPTPTASPHPPTPPVSIDPGCPWPDPLNDTVHLPHENDCTKFYKCDNGRRVEFDCPGGLHFNAELEVCDWPKDAGCEDIPPPPTTARPSSTLRPNPCPTECQDSTIYLPVLSNPRQFIRCVRGIEVVQTCPSNLVFDKRLAVCNLEHQVKP